MKDREIEIRRKSSDPSYLNNFLNKNANLISHKGIQVDIYFVPFHEDYTKESPIRKWFRLRSEDGNYSINFKNWKFNKNNESMNYCDEFSIRVSDYESTYSILDALSFRKIVKISKIRTIWMYNQVEISIDEVDGLGHYVELESKGSGSPKEELNKLNNLANRLKLIEDPSINLGYPNILLQNERTK